MGCSPIRLDQGGPPVIDNDDPFGAFTEYGGRAGYEAHLAKLRDDVAERRKPVDEWLAWADANPGVWAIAPDRVGSHPQDGGCDLFPDPAMYETYREFKGGPLWMRRKPRPAELSGGNR